MRTHDAHAGPFPDKPTPSARSPRRCSAPLRTLEFLKDIWRPLLVEAPVDEIARRGSLEGLPLRWLPAGRDLTFSGDPFGIWRDGCLFVFVEDFDYRTAHGTIGVHVLDERLRWIEKRTVLHEPWHLSYPIVFEWDDEIWLLPEASGSESLALYRAREFPWHWEKVATITLDVVPLDATPVRRDGLWWLFYGAAGSARERLTLLNVAWAEDLLGPWTPHPLNPVLRDMRGARPGGRAFEHQGNLALPIQDCTRSYGSALRLLHVSTLDRDQFQARAGGKFLAPSGATPFLDGCHTLSAAGPVTLVDVKRRHASFKGLTMRPRRDLAKLAARWTNRAQTGPDRS
ncbi:MAG TPA: formyl transferase [Novosphingobium sp.]|nr:formyl transferase [Novosphingobium sp.]